MIGAAPNRQQTPWLYFNANKIMHVRFDYKSPRPGAGAIVAPLQESHVEDCRSHRIQHAVLVLHCGRPVTTVSRLDCQALLMIPGWMASNFFDSSAQTFACAFAPSSLLTNGDGLNIVSSRQSQETIYLRRDTTSAEVLALGLGSCFCRVHQCAAATLCASREQKFHYLH